MALCICKCLNVTLECDKVDNNVELAKLDLTTTEQRDIFFSEKLLSSCIHDMKSQVVQPALINQRVVGHWTLYSCLACGQTTHATLQDRPTVLICKSIVTTPERLNSLKKSSNFSPVFNLLVPEVSPDIEMKENVDTTNFLYSNKKEWGPNHIVGSLSKQLNQTLQLQLESVEETVRQYRDQKYAEYEAYREKAHRDHKILASIIRKSKSNMDNSGCRMDSSIDNGPPSPQLPPLQRRRLSSFKDAKKITNNASKFNRDFLADEDSLEAEDLFELEGTDSRHTMVSDQDDYDSDQGSNDEGIHISRPRGGQYTADLARSLPVDMPNMAKERPVNRDLDDEEDPQDIAASIKALARSVHGDVFELPRPRFSTQI